ncbi:MAG: hypothetical protein NVSMB17_13380 [Candidatus Dormibacteria bacterium]
MHPTTPESPSPDVVGHGVLLRAAQLGNSVERRLGGWSMPWWQLPPRVRGRGGIVARTARDGWDATAYAVLAARWLLLSGPPIVVGVLLVGLAPTTLRAPGVLLELAGLVCAAAGWRRQFQAFSARSRWRREQKASS